MRRRVQRGLVERERMTSFGQRIELAVECDSMGECSVSGSCTQRAGGSTGVTGTMGGARSFLVAGTVLGLPGGTSHRAPHVWSSNTTKGLEA